MPRMAAQILYENYNDVHRGNEIAVRKGVSGMGYIDSRQITKLAEPMLKTGYGEYLWRLAEENDKS